MVTAHSWRSRRSAAIAGIAFAVLLLAAMTLMRLALAEGSLVSLQSDAQRRNLIRLSLNLVPFAGIAFLWFIGVVREQLGRSRTAGPNINADIWAFGRDSTNAIVSVYAMRMAAVFTLSVSTLVLRTSAMPRWVAYLGYLSALVLLLAAGDRNWTQPVFPGWVLLLSVVILFTRSPDRVNVTDQLPQDVPPRRD